MRKLLRHTLNLFLVFGLLFCLTGYAEIPAAADNNSKLPPMLQKVLPAVVNIRADIKITDLATLSRLQQERGIPLNSAGDIPDTFLSVASGVIVDASKGYILTNAHVVNDAQTVTVTLGDSRHFTAKVIGLDKPSDVALLQIKAKNLTAIGIANSNSLKVGDTVLAIGNPFGLSQTVTSGIVSALGRTSLGIENYENFIQTDASINPGNSGGALIDTQGNLVGINTAILAPERGNIGIGFAIPSDIAKSVMLQLIQYGDVKRGTLGIGAQDISPDLASALGLTDTNGSAITLVRIESPAESAGLQVGDIITSINGNKIKNANDVVTTVGFARVNTKINIDLLRDHKRVTTSAVLIDPKQMKEASAKNNPFLYGVGMNNFAILSPIHGDIHGVMVASVEPDSRAWQADLRAGDVIMSANEEKVNSIPDLQRIAAKAKNTLLINVLRGAGAVFLIINREDS